MSGSRFPRFLILVALVLGTGGCVSKQMASWVGHNQNDLIASWGPPDQSMPDGNGGQILTWRGDSQVVIPGSTSTTTTFNGNTAYTQSYSTPSTAIQVRRFRTFWVNADGIVYR